MCFPEKLATLTLSPFHTHSLNTPIFSVETKSFFWMPEEYSAMRRREVSIYVCTGPVYFGLKLNTGFPWRTQTLRRRRGFSDSFNLWIGWWMAFHTCSEAVSAAARHSELSSSLQIRFQSYTSAYDFIIRTYIQHAWI